MPVLKKPDSPALLQSRSSSRRQELLALNPVLKKHGLSLTPANAEEILESGKRALQNQGRVELGTAVIREITKRLSESSYISQDNFISSVCDLYEIFHFIKNAVSDFISDEEVLDAMMFSFENICHGSIEFLMGKGSEKIIRSLRNEEYEDDDEKDEEEED